MAVKTNRWVWEPTDPARSGSSGDISKLFRHEQLQNPGALADGAPPNAESLLAREVIQNSWDAATELQASMEEPPDFEMRFEFEEFSGRRRESLIEFLDLRSLARRADELDRAALGLDSADCLTDLQRDTPLSLLRIEERGTTGMYGPWEDAKSKMYLALISLGYTEKVAHAGGSYGFGKAGLINSSGIRTIIAYSCFKERADDPGVTRRLIGMTYWGQHRHANGSLTGFARLGYETDAQVVPFENDQADLFAKSLGINIRTPDDPEQLGTTFVVVDPIVSPALLVNAISRWWWPALEENLFEVEVVCPGGSVLHPRPMQDDVLRSFIQAYRIAVTPQDNSSDSQRAFVLRSSASGGSRELGRLGLIADTGLNGWSYADQFASITDATQIAHRSLVALTRSPRMVVQYLDAGRSAPFVRGVFIASEDIDEELRQSEPKGHDSWLSDGHAGRLAPGKGSVADTVISAIRYQVNRFRLQLKPRFKPADVVYLPEFDRFFRRALSGKVKTVDSVSIDDSQLIIRISYAPVVVDEHRIKIVGSAVYELTEQSYDSSAVLIVDIRYRYLDDDRAGDYVPIRVTPPDGFKPLQKTYIGRIHEGDALEFRFESGPYLASWTGRLYATGDLVSPHEVPTS